MDELKVILGAGILNWMICGFFWSIMFGFPSNPIQVFFFVHGVVLYLLLKLLK